MKSKPAAKSMKTKQIQKKKGNIRTDDKSKFKGKKRQRSGKITKPKARSGSSVKKSLKTEAGSKVKTEDTSLHEKGKLVKTEKKESHDYKLKRKRSALDSKDKGKEGEKRKRDGSGLVAQLMVFYEKLRRKDISREQKEDFIKEIFELIEGKENSIIYKHDSVRVLEMCVKYGNNEQRQKIYDIYKEHNAELLKCTYSKFLVRKLIKYGNKERRHMVIKSLFGKVRRLIRHQNAAGVLEYIFHSYADSSERASLIEEFYGPQYAVFKASVGRKLDDIFEVEPERKPEILKYMKEALGPLVQKDCIQHTIVHKPLQEFFDHAEDPMRAEMIETLREKIVQMVHTYEGSRVAMNCIWFGTKKDRKSLVKSFKTFVCKICKEEYGYLVLLALFDVIDDTVLVKKTLFPEIISNFDDLLHDQYGRKVILYLLSRRDKKFFPVIVLQLLEKGDTNETSKKDSKTREDELREGILPRLCEYFIEHAENIIKDKSICQILLAAMEHSEDMEKCTDVMRTISELVSAKFEPESQNEDHPIGHPCAHWVIKRLIQQDKNRLEKKQTVLFCRILLEYTQPGTFSKWAQINRGAFVVSSLLESGIEDVVNHVKKDLKGVQKKLDVDKSKGAQVLLKLLKKDE